MAGAKSALDPVWDGLTSQICAGALFRLEEAKKAVRSDFASRGMLNSSSWAIAEAKCAESELQAAALEIASAQRYLLARIHDVDQMPSSTWLGQRSLASLDNVVSKLRPAADARSLAASRGLQNLSTADHVLKAFDTTSGRLRSEMIVVADNTLAQVTSELARRFGPTPNDWKSRLVAWGKIASGIAG